jgi:hypothetical protein
MRSPQDVDILPMGAAQPVSSPSDLRGVSTPGTASASFPLR